jgi:cell division protein ZapE
MIADGSIGLDRAQGKAVYTLSNMFDQLSESGRTPKGFYMHGQVGCGKTLALNIFANCVHVALPHIRLCRVHLNDFLELVHSELRRESSGVGVETNLHAEDLHESGRISKPFNLGRQDDRGTRRTGSAAAWVHHVRKGAVRPSIGRLAAEIAKNLDVLCLDEVAITTLQNCVIFGPLIEALCDAGVTFVATSNKAPSQLYAEGIDRARHLAPLSSAISRNCIVYDYCSSIDYRKSLPVDDTRTKVFRWSSAAGTSENASFLESWWDALACEGAAPAKIESVPVGYGRTLPVNLTRCGACARFSFEELCTCPPVALGAADYSVLCKRFSTLVVADVPRLRPESLDAARRWTLFLDSCYENHVRLIISSIADGPEDLLDLSDASAGEGQSSQEASFAVARGVSRMHEMQSGAYLDVCAQLGVCAAHF